MADRDKEPSRHLEPNRDVDLLAGCSRRPNATFGSSGYEDYRRTGRGADDVAADQGGATC